MTVSVAESGGKARRHRQQADRQRAKRESRSEIAGKRLVERAATLSREVKLVAMVDEGMSFCGAVSFCGVDSPDRVATKTPLGIGRESKWGPEMGRHRLERSVSRTHAKVAHPRCVQRVDTPPASSPLFLYGTITAFMLKELRYYFATVKTGNKAMSYLYL